MRVDTFKFFNSENKKLLIKDKNLSKILSIFLLAMLINLSNTKVISKEVKKINGQIILENQTFNTSCSCENLAEGKHNIR
jgi:hypothetical protein